MHGALAALLAGSGSALAADAAFQWDYAHEGVAGFALYCGSASRSYSSRIDVGNADFHRLPLPDDTLTFCAVSAYDEAGYESGYSNEVAVITRSDTQRVEWLPPFTVREQGWLQPTASGFSIGVSVPVSPAGLNLYGSTDDADPRADITLAGVKTGTVKGSMVLSADHRALTLVRTGGLLLPDTYTLTIENRPFGLADWYGRSLEDNGVAGEDYRTTFVVPETSAPVVEIGEFARGPGQAVNLPASDLAAGIPVRVSRGLGVEAVAFTLRYDPALLAVQRVTLASGISAELAVAEIDPVAGAVRVEVTGISNLTSAATTLLRLQASVPESAPHGAQHVLDVQRLSFNRGMLSGLDDDGVHLVAKLGSASGLPRYSSYDALLIQRVILRINTGFSAFPLTDPVIVGDVNGTGRLDSHDALLIQLRTLGEPIPDIPD